MKKAGNYINQCFARKTLPLLLLVCQASAGRAQQNLTALDFREVDSFVTRVKFENDYIKLANDLAAPYKQDVYKTRAIFKWITNNIAFDYRSVNSEKEIEVPDCADKYDCAEILRAWENNYIKKILRTKKAVSDGYARLFQKLCEINHIQCEVVNGYARTKPYQIGNKLSANHNWNAVFLDTAWYFLDVTWAAGYTVENDDGKLLRYVKDFQNYYWLNSFERFARNHYPKNTYWGDQYKISLQDFFNRPHYYSVDMLENISGEYPSTGMLTVKKDDTIYFCLNYSKEIRNLQINTNNFRNPSLWTTVAVSKKKTKLVRDTWAEKKQVYIPFSKQGYTYEFYYVAKDISLYYLELVFDYKKAIRYKINVTK